MSYKKWKKEIEDLDIMCQWGSECGGKSHATCRAHIVGSETFRMNTNEEKGEVSELNDLPEVVLLEDEHNQIDSNVMIGITCKDCDTFLRRYESDKRKFIPVTLWKVAASFKVIYHSECTFGTGILNFPNSTIPSEAQIELAKKRTRDYLDNEGAWLFTEVDLESYYPKFKKICKKNGNDIIIPFNEFPRYSLGRVFIGSDDKEDSYFQFNIYDRHYVVSTFKYTKIPKSHIMEHALTSLIQESGEPTNTKLPKNKNSKAFADMKKDIIWNNAVSSRDIKKIMALEDYDFEKMFESGELDNWIIKKGPNFDKLVDDMENLK